MRREEAEKYRIGAGKDSPLRIATKEQMYAIAGALHERYPNLSPNTVTAGGLIGAVVFGKILENQNRKDERHNVIVVAADIGLGAAFGVDGLDGPLSDLIRQENPERHDPSKGERNDVMADRLEEISLAFMRAETARQQGRVFGEIAALSYAMTAALPSYVKNKRKARGEVIQEVNTQNPIVFLGERPMRAVLGTITPAVSRIQPWADAAGTVANLSAAWDRRKSPVKRQATEEEMETAKLTVKWLKRTEGATVLYVACIIGKRTVGRRKN